MFQALHKALPDRLAAAIYSEGGRIFNEFLLAILHSQGRFSRRSRMLFMVICAARDVFDFNELKFDSKHIFLRMIMEKNLLQQLLQRLHENAGFAFIGQQYHVAVGNKDYYIDLLFYHVPLKRYFVIELKAREFDYLDAGQISFYITAIDEQLRAQDDNPRDVVGAGVPVVAGLETA